MAVPAARTRFGLTETARTGHLGGHDRSRLRFVPHRRFAGGCPARDLGLVDGSGFLGGLHASMVNGTL